MEATEIIIQELYKYHGFGFPVFIENLEMINIEGELHPKIDIKKLADYVVQLLAFQKERLTGNQVKFIRTYLSMSIKQFAKTVANETHSEVEKWEKCKNCPTKMNKSTEIIIKLSVTQYVRKCNLGFILSLYNEIKDLNKEVKKEIFIKNDEWTSYLIGTNQF